MSHKRTLFHNRRNICATFENPATSKRVSVKISGGKASDPSSTRLRRFKPRGFLISGLRTRDAFRHFLASKGVDLKGVLRLTLSPRQTRRGVSISAQRAGFSTINPSQGKQPTNGPIAFETSPPGPVPSGGAHIYDHGSHHTRSDATYGVHKGIQPPGNHFGGVAVGAPLDSTAARMAGAAGLLVVPMVGSDKRERARERASVMEMPHRIGFDTTPPPTPGWDRHLEPEVRAEVATGVEWRDGFWISSSTTWPVVVVPAYPAQSDPGDEQ